MSDTVAVKANIPAESDLLDPNFSQVKTSGIYAFDDPNHDPYSKFPAFMAALKIKYPDYGMVFNRRRHRWYAYVQVGQKVFPIYPCQNEDGTAADPSMSFLDHLIETDWTSEFDTVEKAIEAVEKEDTEQDEYRRKVLDAFWLERRTAFLERMQDRRRKSQMTDGELSATLAAIKTKREQGQVAVPWNSHAHLKGVARQMQADAKGATE